MCVKHFLELYSICFCTNIIVKSMQWLNLPNTKEQFKTSVGKLKKPWSFTHIQILTVRTSPKTSLRTVGKFLGDYWVYKFPCLRMPPVNPLYLLYDYTSQKVYYVLLDVITHVWVFRIKIFFGIFFYQYNR